MRCPRCGNENPDQNRFCGMCGATLLAAPEAQAAQPQRVATTVSTSVSQATAPRQQAPEPARPAVPPSNDPPSISGPSFLGLNDPGPRKRASLSIDPHSAPSSRNLDYLLKDDEEPHKSSGAGKFLLILIALVLAVGLGYLRWKNHGFAWLGSINKPSAATQTPSDTNSPTSPTPDSQPPVTTQPGTPPTQAPAISPPASTTPAATPASGNAAPGNAASANSNPGNTIPAATPSTAPPSATASTDNAKPTDATNSAAGTDIPTQPAAKPATPPVKQPANTSAEAADDSDDAKSAAGQPQPKPRPAVKPSAPADPVAEAQKYLYGRGVPQDCERGMRLLKPAASQSNPKAMIEMGALYSAGLCTPHDLPTAYRWFAMALRKDPNNDQVQSDLQKLWGEMTQPERQLAIKLTQ